MKIFFNNTKFSKIFSGLMLLFIFTNIFFTVYPKKSFAQFATAEAGPNLWQSIVNTVNTTTTAITSFYQKYKDTVLDRIAVMAAKQLIRQMTAEVVNWINSGFKGSPAFLQNPGSFFLDVADQVTGAFLDKYKGPLVELCSPFSIDIRLALSFKYHPKTLKRYECTLGVIIKNSENAVKNASINGFTAGDFRQGGWPAFISMTTEPQNNPYSAYLSAESELSFRVANAQGQQRDELGAGQGFLSWRDPKCTDKVKKYQANVATIKDEDDYLNRASEFEKTPRTDLDCPVLTPGKVIGESLQNNLNGPLRELELVDSINQIVDALFAQLVTQVLTKGLTSVSSKNKNATTTFLEQTVMDINAEANPHLQTIKTELIANTEAYKKNTVEYKQNRDEALNIMLDIKNSYDIAKICFETKLASNNSSGNSREQEIRNYIAEINTLNTTIAVKITNLLLLAKQADERLKTLNDIQTQASSAKTLNDVRVPSQKYADILGKGAVVTGIELLKSKDDLIAIRSESAVLKLDASRKWPTCQAIN